VFLYRPARNTDPPGFMQLWNETVAGRGAFPIRSPQTLERWLFSKIFYANQDLLLAVEEATGKLVGFALMGFAPNDEFDGLNRAHGIICAVAVHPEFRRRGIGKELLNRSDANLRERGATQITLGSAWPNSPYLFGLYGGSNAPGFLESDAELAPFFAKQGYTPEKSVTIFQKKLDTPLTIADNRFGMLRRRYDMQLLRAANVAHWWQECAWGILEPLEVRLFDKLTSLPAARAVLWDLEGFAWRWNSPSAGILDVQVRSDLRKLGLGKLLLSNVFRLLQDQFFAIAELQIPTDDEAAMGLCKSVEMEAIDRGVTYTQK
jgi:ribosomal protein S18 acetylase RimI-like enzyme